ncbi:hydratase [Dysosmobacter sp.]|uniref:hydratase n=1 Tax=Dysosmobacter sp. TaxID=2591382 RepID=UPI002A8B4D12|nr:hydratase [Dysosmobacter sp.]MDY3986164.1 hydratase [Dysosmobacter sp.]
MIQLIDRPVSIGPNGPQPLADAATLEAGREKTIAYGILNAHNTTNVPGSMKLKFDSLISHDITYVGVIQTARASGLKEFPLPYVLTNCHNSLCAVGGTINRDDHMFGMSACEKYGGIFVPANQSVIHSYAREVLSGCGRMVLGSDSHTRYGALGTLGVGEGGGELVKQLLSRTYDITPPEVIAVYLTGKPRHGVGPQDIALALVGAVFANGFVKNKVLEFVGPGVANLSIDFRNGVDVMTTETTCLTSVWQTDGEVEKFFRVHGRPECYKELTAAPDACYDGAVVIDLDTVEPMIAFPFHPSNVYSIREFLENPEDILAIVEEKAQKQIANPNLRLDLRSKLHNGRFRVDQADIAGCSGGSFENLVDAARIMDSKSIPNEFFTMSIYPASNPVLMELLRTGDMQKLISAGAILKSSFCGPCFGAGDVPSNGSIAIRHPTRNFPNREGSKPKENQMASVALMDARSIAATAVNGGYLTPATEVDYDDSTPEYHYDAEIYRKTVYNGFGHPKPEAELRLGPNITDWPEMIALQKNALLEVCSVIPDPVTTTDELIPSGDTSSYRSNPIRMSDFTLSRRDPAYVGRAKTVQALELARQKGEADETLTAMARQVCDKTGLYSDPAALLAETGIGSVVCSNRPGDGSAREQAASCQRVLGGLANICVEYATKRYRSNLVNWGMIPFIWDNSLTERLSCGDLVFVPDAYEAVKNCAPKVDAWLIKADGPAEKITLDLKNLSPEEAGIILAGSLINYYASENN